MRRGRARRARPRRHPPPNPKRFPAGRGPRSAGRARGRSQRTRSAARLWRTGTTATISTGATPVLVAVTCLVTNSPAGHSSRSPHSYRERTEAPEERSPRTSFCFSKSSFVAPPDAKVRRRRGASGAASARPGARGDAHAVAQRRRAQVIGGEAERAEHCLGDRARAEHARVRRGHRRRASIPGYPADGGGPRRWPARDSSAAVNTPSAASFVFVALASLPMIPSSPAVASTRSAVCTACAGNSAPSGACARGSGAPSRNARRHRASSVAAASRSASAPWLASGRGAFVATIAPRGACLCSSGSSRHTRSSAETAAGGVQGGRCAPPFSFLANWASFGPRFWRGGGTFTLGFRAPLPPSPPRPPSRAGCGAILTRPPPRV